MIGRYFLTLFIITITSFQLVGESTLDKWPSIQVGAGLLVYDGNIGSLNDITTFTIVRPGFNFSVEQRFWKIFGISANGLYGTLAASEHNTLLNRNFQSAIYQGDLSLFIHTDKLFPNAKVTPYIGIGYGLMHFDPYSDLKASNGMKYFYWDDGSIRNEPELPNINYATLQTLHRDYTYETKLDSLNKYKHTTIIIPLSFGFNFKLSNHINASLGGTYYLTKTNNVDNIGSGKNDAYYYVNTSITISFGHPDRGPEDKRYDNIDFSKIDDSDADGDGIKDTKDLCPNTPKGVKVDENGCPLDSDGDGIPNYLDKEPHSKKGALVDENGVTITEEMLNKKKKEWDEAVVERNNTFNANPTSTTINQIEKKVMEEKKGAGMHKTIPDDLKEADSNLDGFIQANEITKAIDGFFTGENNFTVEKINRLIDYFFEQ